MSAARARKKQHVPKVKKKSVPGKPPAARDHYARDDYALVALAHRLREPLLPLVRGDLRPKVVENFVGRAV